MIGADGVGRIATGRRVFFTSPVSPHGSWAERTLVAEQDLLDLADDVDDVTAAALGSTGLVAWLALTWRAARSPSSLPRPSVRQRWSPPTGTRTGWNSMIDQTTRYAVKVRITNRKELENKLDRAVEGAIREALEDPGGGVLVTRHDHRTFTVEPSHDVPPGTISEIAHYPLV